jgi:hypothetical protein
MASAADPESVAFLTPGSGMGKKSRSGIRIRHEHSGSYFRELRINFWVKIPVLKFFDADPDPGSEIFFTLDPGWVKNQDPDPG